MRGYKLLAAAVAVLVPVVGLYAQITVKAQLPPSGQLKFDDLWSCEINNSADKTFTVVLEASLSAIAADNSVDAIARANSNTLELAHGSKKVSATDITEVKNPWFKPGFEDLVKSGSLPTGAYQIEVTVKSSKGDELAWDHAVVSTAPPTPPRLAAPAAGEVVDSPNPAFEWRAPSPLAPDAQVTYHIKIVEIEPGQTTEEALKNPVWFEDPSVTGTSLTYPAEAKPFVKGAHYLWQVAATVGSAPAGVSETWSFSPAPQVAEIDIGRSDIAAALELTANHKVRTALQDAAVKFDNARDAINNKDAKSALKWEKEALKAVNDILNAAPKTKESTDFVDRLKNARRKLEAEIGGAIPKK